MNIRHYLIPAVITVFSVVIIVLSLQLDVSPPIIVGESMQPRSFPIFLMVINLILVAFLTFQIWKDPPHQARAEPLATWGTILLMGVFYPLTVYLDMFIGIAVVMFVMCILWGERRLLVAAATAILTPFVIFLLFDFVLQIRFPRGILMNWYYG